MVVAWWAAHRFGYVRGALNGQQVELLVPTSVRDHSQHRIGYVRDLVARPMGVGMELAARRADGTEFPAEIALAPLRIEGSLLVLAAVRDITERKRAEAKFRSLLEAAQNTSVRVTPDRLIHVVTQPPVRPFVHKASPPCRPPP